tara:strand:+ start:663 stop:872 length:210 start_codon:yes stop_codon:yes gene_type:complete
VFILRDDVHFFNDVFDENTKKHDNNNDNTPTALNVLERFSFVLSLFLFRAVDGEFKVKSLLSSYIKQCI